MWECYTLSYGSLLRMYVYKYDKLQSIVQSVAFHPGR